MILLDMFLKLCREKLYRSLLLLVNHRAYIKEGNASQNAKKGNVGWFTYGSCQNENSIDDGL
jgi:hypothetical protein